MHEADTKLERADGQLDSDIKDRDTLIEGHKTCAQITASISAVDLLPMVEQSRQIKKLVQNNKKWVALFKRLKLLADDEFPNIERDL